MNDSVRMVPLLRQDFDASVCVLTLDRPEKRNALSIELRFALADALDALATDDRIDAVVLTGERTWLPLLDDELEQLRTALLG